MDFQQIFDLLLEDRQVGQEVELEEELVMKVCQKFQEVYQNQSAVQDITSEQCYIVGDVHGQFYDVVNYFKTLALPSVANYIFLGDYVDRGVQSVETVMLLFLAKILFPSNITLLRGNHEQESQCCSQNYAFPFITEVEERFDNYESVMKVFLRSFEFLPLVAVLNKKVLCVHGCIPSFIRSLNPYREINLPVQSNQLQSNIIQHLLWSDIVRTAIIDAEIEFNGEVFSITSNPRRGVGEQVPEGKILKFLEENNMEVLFRGHEAARDGAEIGVSGRVFTIFGATNYYKTNQCDGAVVALIDGETINFEIFRSDYVEK
ncbi:Serine/threonine-protein phosphatase [Spironucleus salmonicida]|uniref:Serine/threonine-protein phosphatase n=1 Tax=Spironucleus salmonicida TaxID=348837 RepID=V6M0D4_9EUKA|nr:Serine/threonine-protein phosphatase [Spironucleus salmonicida]|eukprot:EST46594.1 Serine/threonine-protein phosphatase [Spironucleus salmonicida]